MGLLTTIFLSVFTFFFGGGIIWILVWQILKLRREKKRDRQTIVINYLPEWTNGHAIGWLIQQKKTPSGLTRVEYEATDLSKKERAEGEEHNEVVIAKTVKTTSIGILSSNINIVRIYPNTGSELREKIPEINFRLNTLSLDKDLKESIEKIQSSLKKKNGNIQEELKLLLLELKKTVSNLPKNKKGNIDKLTAEVEKVSKEINTINEHISNQGGILEKIKTIFTEVSLKDLYNHLVLREDLMYELGYSMKKGYQGAIGTVEDLNFGAVSALDKKKQDEYYKRLIDSEKKSKEA